MAKLDDRVFFVGTSFILLADILTLFVIFLFPIFPGYSEVISDYRLASTLGQIFMLAIIFSLVIGIVILLVGPKSDSTSENIRENVHRRSIKRIRLIFKILLIISLVFYIGVVLCYLVIIFGGGLDVDNMAKIAYPN